MIAFIFHNGNKRGEVGLRGVFASLYDLLPLCIFTYGTVERRLVTFCVTCVSEGVYHMIYISMIYIYLSMAYIYVCVIREYSS